MILIFYTLYWYTVPPASRVIAIPGDDTVIAIPADDRVVWISAAA